MPEAGARRRWSISSGAGGWHTATGPGSAGGMRPTAGGEPGRPPAVSAGAGGGDGGWQGGEERRGGVWVCSAHRAGIMAARCCLMRGARAGAELCSLGTATGPEGTALSSVDNKHLFVNIRK